LAKNITLAGAVGQGEGEKFDLQGAKIGVFQQACAHARSWLETNHVRGGLDHLGCDRVQTEVDAHESHHAARLECSPDGLDHFRFIRPFRDRVGIDRILGDQEELAVVAGDEPDFPAASWRFEQIA
jgi:hypothetical protein